MFGCSIFDHYRFLDRIETKLSLGTGNGRPEEDFDKMKKKNPETPRCIVILYDPLKLLKYLLSPL